MNASHTTAIARRTLATLLTSGLLAGSVAGAAGAAGIRPMLLGRAPSDRNVATVVPHVAGVRDLGRIGGNVPVHIGILLRYQHQAELEALVRLQGERGSAYYHRYLSPAQWNAYFAPSPAQYQKVANAVRRAGFLVDQTTVANRGIVMARGRAGSAETYFSTKIHTMLQSGHVRYANVTTAVMPAEIRQESVSVLGLHSIEIAHYPALHVAPLRQPLIASIAPHPELLPAPQRSRTRGLLTAAAKPITNATPSPNPAPDATLAPIVQVDTSGTGAGVAGATADYGPYGMAVAYDYPVLHGWNGKGRNTGNVISADIANSDINGFITTFKLPRPLLPKSGDDALTHRVIVDGPPGAQEGEETLDAEAIIGLAPGTNYYEYAIPLLSDLEIANAYNRADSDALVDGLNSSFGGCESDDPSGAYSEDYLAMQGVAKGITYSASTGDTGSNGCEIVMNGAPGTAPGVEAPSAGYYFTGVGGTAITLNPNTGAVLLEMGWIDGGGGVSKINPLPDWQTATIAAATPDTAPASTYMTPAANSGRNLPDIGLFSDQQDGAVAGGFAFYYQGAVAGVGGTSLSSPLWIAMQSEIDEIQGTKNGWVNPRLYAIYNQNGYTQFRDVMTGNNTAYTNVPGYDNITGIGAPLGFELAGTE